MEQFRGTTIVSVRRNGKVAIAGDGQVSMGNTVMKGNAKKVRRLADGRVIAGFAGGTADAFTLFELFESKLEQYGNLTRAAIELAKDWRTDRRLRRLEALLCVADEETSLIISGNGDVIEPENDLMAIGSGGPFAQAAALALLQNTELAATEIVEKALLIAGDICVFTNQNILVEELLFQHHVIIANPEHLLAPNDRRILMRNRFDFVDGMAIGLGTVEQRMIIEFNYVIGTGDVFIGKVGAHPALPQH